MKYMTGHYQLMKSHEEFLQAEARQSQREMNAACGDVFWFADRSKAWKVVNKAPYKETELRWSIYTGALE